MEKTLLGSERLLFKIVTSTHTHSVLKFWHAKDLQEVLSELIGMQLPKM